MRKEGYIFKANRKREIGTTIITVAYGALIGYEASISIFDQSGTLGPSLGYVLIILLAPVATYQTTVSMVTEMTTERSNKMRESLKILGLNQYVYAISHLSIRTVFSSVLGMIMAAFIYFFNMDYMTGGQFFQLICSFLLLGLGNLTLVLILQNFFDNARLASIVVPTLLFFPSGLAMLSILLPVVNM